MKSLTNKLKENKEFLLSSGVYLTASAIDYISTAIGIETGNVTEANPIINFFISNFGTHGILIPKLLIFSSIIPLLKYAEDKPVFKIKKFKSKYVLYPASILTAGTGLSWLAEKYLFKL